jgi:hypothetical protein
MVVDAYTRCFEGIETYGFWNYVRFERILNELKKTDDQNFFMFKWHTSLLDNLSNDEYINFWYEALITDKQEPISIYTNIMVSSVIPTI